MKQCLLTPPILKYPDFTKEFFLTTDAGDIALGAILSQKYDSYDLPVAYASRVLPNSEKNYAPVKKGLLAIIWEIRKFRLYLYGIKFTIIYYYLFIITDHKPLTYLNNPKPCALLLRWRMELEDYDFKIQYKPCRLNSNADALSRIEVANSFVVTRSMDKNIFAELLKMIRRMLMNLIVVM